MTTHRLPMTGCRAAAAIHSTDRRGRTRMSKTSIRWMPGARQRPPASGQTRKASTPHTRAILRSFLPWCQCVPLDQRTKTTKERP